MGDLLIDQRIDRALPLSGTSVGLRIVLIWSIMFSSGDNPPKVQNTLLSTIAANGKQSKQLSNVFHNNDLLYLFLP